MQNENNNIYALCSCKEGMSTAPLTHDMDIVTALQLFQPYPQMTHLQGEVVP